MTHPLVPRLVMVALLLLCACSPDHDVESQGAAPQPSPTMVSVRPSDLAKRRNEAVNLFEDRVPPDVADSVGLGRRALAERVLGVYSVVASTTPESADFMGPSWGLAPPVDGGFAAFRGMLGSENYRWESIDPSRLEIALVAEGDPLLSDLRDIAKLDVGGDVEALAFVSARFSANAKGGSLPGEYTFYLAVAPSGACTPLSITSANTPELHIEGEPAP
ncbi:MAG: hypothetical protein SF028_13510 [Candidatus Sumerlaeia bacterium]|nr:hypothetical protein [Candidatus Sumerlaeia bacterium]